MTDGVIGERGLSVMAGKSLVALVWHSAFPLCIIPGSCCFISGKGRRQKQARELQPAVWRKPKCPLASTKIQGEKQ